MVAIVELKGKQYQVEKGKEIYVDLTGNETGSTFTIDQVLLVKNGNDVKVGQPYVSGASVTFKVEKEVKGEKLTVFKFRRKKRYKKLKGHRQKYQKLVVESLA